LSLIKQQVDTMHTHTTVQTLPSLLTEKELAKYIHKSVSWLQEQRWRATGRAPQHLKIGRTVMYDINDVHSWLENGGVRES
jgi:hypothetical protein